MGKDNEFSKGKVSDLIDVEDDDGREDEKVNDPEDEEDVDLEKLMAEIKEDDMDDDDDSDDDEKSEEEPEDETGKGKKPSTSEDDLEAIVNQRVIAEVNRIIPERLARDRKTQQVQQLEKITGISLEQITKNVIDNMVAEKADELGCSEDEARKIVEKDIELANIKLEKEQETEQKQVESTVMQQVQYLQDKTAFLQKPKLSKLIKEFEAEIDAFSQKGQILDFETAMNQILGQKLATGELLKKVQAGAEQKAIRGNEKRSKSAPAVQKGGNTSTATLTKEERLIAAQLGVSEAEYAKEKLSEANKRKGRNR